MTKFLIIIISSICLSSFILTDDNESCLKEVKMIFNKMNATVPQQNKVYHFKYELSTTLNNKGKDGKNMTNTSEIEIITSKDQKWFLSKDISVYQDKVNCFTVVHGKKMIYWSDMTKDNPKEDKMARFKKVQDTLLKQSDVVSCSAYDKEDISKVVVLKPKPKLASYIEVKQVTYYINSAKQEIKKIKVEYPSNKDILSVLFSFKENDFDYQKEKLNTPIKNLFINSKGSLQKVYEGYQLLDIRNKPKK